MTALRPLVASALLAICLVLPGPVGAIELTEIDETPLRLDITATTVAAWNAAARDRTIEYDRYGDFINRINLQLGWGKLSGGLRLDTVTFANPRTVEEMAHDRAVSETKLRGEDTPEAIAEQEEVELAKYNNGLRTRLRDDYRVGKAWLSYLSKNFEVTAGDSYVSFGRGLVLTLRKQDELAVDTTLLGGKVIARSSLVNFTAVAGIANPIRVDEATGQTLLPMTLSEADIAAGRGEQPTYGQDALFGARGELTWKKAVFALHGVHMSRGDLVNRKGEDIRGANGVQVFGSSISVPLSEYGSAYLEGAWQQYAGEVKEGADYKDFDGDGYAFYSSVDAGLGPLTGTIQLQHYRDFSPLFASVHSSVGAFSALAYSAPPNTETLLADYRFNNFDRCVTGGRSRLDGRVNDDLMVYGTYGRWATWGEFTGNCDVGAPGERNDVDDVGLGFELTFDEAKSHVFGSAGLRHDSHRDDGALYYRELHAEYTLAKALTGPWSMELAGRHRTRYHKVKPEAWNEEEVYLGLKYSPTLVLTAGFEYTGDVGKPSTYFNGTVLWKYTTDSSVRLFAGQQRGSIKCVSGTCREFPAFEGVKAEWTQRY